MVNPAKDYYRTDVIGWAKIGDHKVPIVHVEIGYTLNKIPTLTMQVALGIDPVTMTVMQGLERSNMRFLSQTVQAYVKLTAPPDNKASATGGWPAGDILLFDGFLSSVKGATSSSPKGSKISFSVTATGWLADMYGSSCHAKVYTGFQGAREIARTSMERFLQERGTWENKEAKNVFVSTKNALRTHKVANVRAIMKAGQLQLNSFWKNVLKKLLRDLISQYKTSFGDSKGIDGINDPAVKALDRMDKAPLDNVPPLNLEAVHISGELDTAVAEELSSTFFSAWYTKNVWSALMSLAAKFQYAVVPIVDTATVVPWHPLMPGNPYKTLEPSEYYVIEAALKAPEHVGGLVLTGRLSNTRNFFNRNNKARPVIGFANLPKKLAEQVGNNLYTLFLRAPKWLHSNYEVKDNQENKKIKKTASKANGKGGNGKQQQILDFNKDREYGDSVAESMLYQHLFSNRTMAVGGRLRFDIGPGSLLKINGIGNKLNIQPQQQPRPDPNAPVQVGQAPLQAQTDPLTLYGVVVSVKITITGNPVGSKASTSFLLSHVRSAEEHQELPQATHPLYRVTWRGCPLMADHGEPEGVTT